MTRGAPNLTRSVAVCTACDHWQLDFAHRAVWPGCPRPLPRWWVAR